MAEQEQGMGEHSEWKFWCIGIVTQDKPFGTDKIMVSPIERLPDQSGNPADSKEEFQGRAPSSTGVSASQDLKASKEQEASWVPDGDNHLFTSPMVRKGESVKLYRYADDDEVYWNTIFREPTLRRLERVIYAAGNLKDGEKPLDLDSVYSIDINTLDKNIAIKTTKSDGEKFNYTFIINAKDSKVEIFDNIGNKFCIDSLEQNVYMEDTSGGKIETRDGHPRIFGPKGILLETPAQVHVQSGDTHVDGPTVFTDNVSMKQNLAISSGLSMGSGGGGRATFTGDFDVTGSVTINGPLTATTANFPGGHGPH